MKGTLLALTALAAMGTETMAGTRQRVQPDTDDQKLTKKKIHQEVLRGKGLKWFLIDGVQVLALNRKNAERKVKKLKL